MKTILKLALVAAVLATSHLLPAQQLLHNFSAFQSPDTVFFGNWAQNGDEVFGDATPIATFQQDVDFYKFIGGTNADTANASHFYTSGPLNITGYSLLEISASMLANNAAPTFLVSLFDSNGASAFAFFDTNNFASPGFSTLSTVLFFDPLFDVTSVASFAISGGTPGGSDQLNLAVDNLALSTPIATAVPEPSTYGMCAILTLAAVLGVRRFRRSA